MNKKYFVSTCFLIISLCGYFTTISLSFLVIQEVDARCPNGYHKSPSGDCERVDSSATDSDNDKSSRENNYDDKDDSNNDDNKYFDFTNTKNNKEKNSDGKFHDPLNQIFGNNNDDEKDNNNEQPDKKTMIMIIRITTVMMII